MVNGLPYSRPRHAARSRSRLEPAQRSLVSAHSPPTELVNAIRYVLGNATRHFGQVGADRFSSAPLPPEDRTAMLAIPLGWMLRLGWKRAQARLE